MEEQLTLSGLIEWLEQKKEEYGDLTLLMDWGVDYEPMVPSHLNADVVEEDLLLQFYPA